MECEEFSQTEREMTNALSLSLSLSVCVCVKERERGGERTGPEPYSCSPSPSLSLFVQAVCVLRLLSLSGRGSVIVQLPAVLFPSVTVLGVGSFSQGLSCQCMEPSISVSPHSPFLSFTAGSFLCSNTP